MEHYPTTYDVNYGTKVGAKDQKRTYHQDSSLVEVTELTGANPLQVDFTFEKFSVDSDFASYLKLELYGHYEGNPAHDVKIYIYNWITESWDAFTNQTQDLPSDTEHDTYTFYRKMGGGLMSSDGQILIRVNHDSNGSAGHHLYIDTLKLSGVVLGSVDGAGQLTGI
jgi:hypothetical protein